MRDTIDMAREAGDVVVDSRGRETFSFDSYGLKAFEALVRADEREIAIEDFKHRLAIAIDAMPFGDTAASFAVYIRDFK